MEDKQSEVGADGSTEAVAAGTSGSAAKRIVAAGRETGLDGDIQAKIGQHLRAMYDDVVRQGVPDRFMDLLSRLDGHDEREKGR
ncbi:NepR family anti-sigma factor [Ancylobacter terrae]|uniref:NepR family anti-sigma factor n=1 Tax=Ancylobacter sp. sgz301288 TaxID=3342077 RepID=UPI0038591CC9